MGSASRKRILSVTCWRPLTGFCRTAFHRLRNRLAALVAERKKGEVTAAAGADFEKIQPAMDEIGRASCRERV